MRHLKTLIILVLALALVPTVTAQAWCSGCNLSDGLVAWWSLDSSQKDATDYFDEVGGHKATITGTTINTTGRRGQAVFFDGINDFLNVADSNGSWLPNGSNNRTMVGWVYSGSTAQQSPFGYGGGGGCPIRTANIWELSRNPAASREMYWTTCFDDIDSTQVITNAMWQFLGMTYDGTTIRLYVNGTETDNAVKALVTRTYTNPFEIGRSTQGSTHWFEGTIDEVGIYNRSLSADELLALYNGTSHNGQGCNPARFSECNVTLVAPNVTDVIPQGTTFDVATTVSIRANITDEVNTIDTTTYMITLPNGHFTTGDLILESGDEFRANFTNTSLFGTYNFTIVATSDVGSTNDTETGTFVVGVARDSDYTLAIIFIFIAIAGMFAWFSINLSETNWGLKLLFFLSTFLILILVMVEAKIIADDFSGNADLDRLLDTGYFATIIYMTFIFFYIVTRIIFRLFQRRKEVRLSSDETP